MDRHKRNKLYIILIIIIAVLFALWYAINEKRAEQYHVSMLSCYSDVEVSSLYYE